MVIWLIGLSGSGKSTICKYIFDQWKVNEPGLVFLDGDILRDVWGDQLGHSIEAREINAHRISNLCKVLDTQGISVVASVLSLFPEWQKWNRNNFSNYYEVFLDVPLSELKKRDPKGIYSKAKNGNMKNVVGIDIPFLAPPSPDLKLLKEDFKQSPEKLAELILQKANVI